MSSSRRSCDGGCSAPAAGRSSAGETVVDFRETIPSASEFDRIWASGTTQNHVREPGRYRVYLAREGELSALRRGSYIVEVALGDTRGNGTRSEFELALRGVVRPEDAGG